MRRVLVALLLLALVLACSGVGYLVGLMTGDPKGCAEGGAVVGAFVAFWIGLEEVL